MAKRDPRREQESVAAIIASIKVVPLRAVHGERIMMDDSSSHFAAMDVPLVIISRKENCREFVQNPLSALQEFKTEENRDLRRTLGGGNRGIQLLEVDRLFC